MACCDARDYTPAAPGPAAVRPVSSRRGVAAAEGAPTAGWDYFNAPRPATPPQQDAAGAHESGGVGFLWDWGSWIGLSDSSDPGSHARAPAGAPTAAIPPPPRMLPARPRSGSGGAEPEAQSDLSESESNDEEEQDAGSVGATGETQAGFKSLLALNRDLREFDTVHIPPQEQAVLTRQKLLERHLQDRAQIGSGEAARELAPDSLEWQMAREIDSEIARDRELLKLHKDKLKEMKHMRHHLLRKVEHAREAASLGAEGTKGSGPDHFFIAPKFQNLAQAVTEGTRARARAHTHTHQSPTCTNRLPV